MTINVYLNEICKGAMSLQDFIDKIQVLEDIDYRDDMVLLKEEQIYLLKD